MAKMTHEQHDKLITLVDAYAEDYSDFMKRMDEDPEKVVLATEMLNSMRLGQAITDFVESLM